MLRKNSFVVWITSSNFRVLTSFEPYEALVFLFEKQLQIVSFQLLTRLMKIRFQIVSLIIYQDHDDLIFNEEGTLFIKPNQRLTSIKSYLVNNTNTKTLLRQYHLQYQKIRNF